MANRRNHYDDGGNSGGDGWIWGNHRGGGGAPLKDEFGNSIANLKAVLKTSPAKGGSNKNYDRDDYRNEPRGPPPKGKVPPLNRNRPPPDDEDDYREPPKNSRNIPPRRPVPRNFDQDDSDYDQHSNNNHHRGGGRGGGRDKRDDDYDSRDRDRDNHHGQYVEASQGGSPKRFMNSLAEINGVTDRDRQEKLR
jgi:hypothetical protein